MTHRFLPFLALSVALAACSAVPDVPHAATPADLSAVSLTAPLAALGAQGLPFDASGQAVVGAVRVKIRDANAQLMTFDGQNVYQPGGPQDSVVLTKTANSTRVLLPAGTYTLESAGTAPTGEFLAYGQTTLHNVNGGNVKLALHALLDPAAVNVAFPAASITPDTVQDARLIVPTVMVNGTRLTVPTSDFTASFTASSGSLLGSSKLGALMKSDNQTGGSVGVNASVQGWVATGPDTAALGTVSVSGSVPISTTLTPGLYEENNASFRYSGSWTHNPYHAPSHGGGDQYTATAGDSMTFDFQGRGLSVYVNTYPGAGTYEIYLDGNYVTSYNTYSATELPQTEMYRLDTLDPTVAHTVTLVCTSPNCVFDYAVVR